MLLGGCWDRWEPAGHCEPWHKEPRAGKCLGTRGRSRAGRGRCAREEGGCHGTVTGRGQQGGEAWSEEPAKCGHPSPAGCEPPCEGRAVMGEAKAILGGTRRGISGRAGDSLVALCGSRGPASAGRRGAETSQGCRGRQSPGDPQREAGGSCMARRRLRGNRALTINTSAG